MKVPGFLHFIGFIFAINLSGCTSKNRSQITNADSTVKETINHTSRENLNHMKSDSLSFNGKFEYDGGSLEEGYWYYILDIKQTGKNLKGTLYMGNYLSRSAAGGYIMPGASIEIHIYGEARGSTSAIIYPGEIIDTNRIEASYKYPDLSNIFINDAQDNPLQLISIVENKIRFVNNTDTLVWDRIK